MQRIVGADPEQIGRQLAHLVSVALGKSLAPHLASPGSVAGRSQLNTWTAYEPPRTTGESEVCAVPVVDAEADERISRAAQRLAHTAPPIPRVVDQYPRRRGGLTPRQLP